MGCGSSKNQVGLATSDKPEDGSPDSPAKAKGTPTKVKRQNSRTIKIGPASADGTPHGTPKHSRTSRLRKGDSCKGSQGSLGGSQTSLNGAGRGGSAGSAKSGDSGFDDHDKPTYITEGSDADLVKKVENDFRDPNLEMNIVGTAVPRRASANDKERKEEAAILSSLRQEGLIQRPMSRAQGGLSFEVVEDTSQRLPPIRPPVRLAKLEKRQKKHKRTLTSEDIEAKLEKAEQRKKELEQQRLQRIQSITNQSDVNQALDNFAESQREKVTEIKSKEEIAAENREKKLRELQEKMRAKQERAEAVRRRKMSVLAVQGSGEGYEGEEAMPPRKSYTEDTPVGRGGGDEAVGYGDEPAGERENTDYY